MNLIRFLACQFCFALALHHVYLEELLHKALDPLFGPSFISSFVGSYEFDPPHALTYLDLIKWNKKAVLKSSAWLLKLGQSNFADAIKTIFVVVGCWKEVVRTEQNMRHANVVEECALLCVEMCANLFIKADENILRKTDLCRDFFFLLYNVHRRPNQTGYFSILNGMNEQMERVLNPIKQQISIEIVEYNYDEMHRLALLMKSLPVSLNIGIENNLINSKPTSCAEGMLRVASYSRFREHCRRKGSTRDVERMQSEKFGSSFTVSCMIYMTWLPLKVQEVLLPIFREILKQVKVKSIEVTVRKVEVDLLYPLPLSIKLEFERTEEGMTSGQVIGFLFFSQSYRSFARQLHQLHSLERYSTAEKLATHKASRDKYLEVCSQRLPNNFVNLFHWHTLMLTQYIKYDASIVHFTNLPVDAVKDDDRGGMGREYLQRIAWWINEVTESVPIYEREEHLKLLLQFVSQEVNYVIPFEQRELTDLTIMLMIEGAFNTNMIT